MAYRMAGIDVHKKRLAVVMADIEVEDAHQFELCLGNAGAILEVYLSESGKAQAGCRRHWIWRKPCLIEVGVPCDSLR